MCVTQAELEKLYGMKQELQQAAHRCENMGSMESLDKLDTAVESPLAQFADQVNKNLQDCINQVSEQASRQGNPEELLQSKLCVSVCVCVCICLCVCVHVCVCARMLT